MYAFRVYLVSMLLMSVIIDDMNAEAYVDNIQLPELLGEMHPYFIMDTSISVNLISVHLLGYTEVPGCDNHKKYSDVCAFRERCSGNLILGEGDLSSKLQVI